MAGPLIYDGDSKPTLTPLADPYISYQVLQRLTDSIIQLTPLVKSITDQRGELENGHEHANDDAPDDNSQKGNDQGLDQACNP